MEYRNRQVLKEDIIGLLQTGSDATTIAKRVGFTKRTAYRWIKRYKSDGNNERHPPLPRPRFTTATQDEDIEEAHLRVQFRPTLETAVRHNTNGQECKMEGSSKVVTNNGVNKTMICMLCSNNTERNPDVVYFTFPPNPYKRRKWMKIANMMDTWNDYLNKFTTYRICEVHFESKYLIYKFGQKSLKSTAIPTLYLLHRPSISTIISATGSKYAGESSKEMTEDSENATESSGRNGGSNQAELKKEANKPIANADNEKFKRALIRMVSAHLKKGTQMTGVEMWTEIEKAIGSDCTVLWQRMRALTESRMNRLLIHNDYTDLVNPIVRMTRTDWLMYDLILVHEAYDVISSPDSATSDKSLMELLNLVSKYSIENLDVASLPKAWLKLSREYNRNGRSCSIMLLQKRWYQIKAQTRHIFYDFWFKHHKNFAACKTTPRYLFIETANMFPNIISAYFPKWEELVEQKLIVLPEVFESIINPKPIDTESDVILVEKDIEVVEIDDDNDPKEDSAPNNTQTIKDKIMADFDDDISVSPIPEEMLPKIIKVKSETDEVPMVENSSIENDCLSQIQIVATTHVQEVDTVIEPDQQGTSENKTVHHEALVKIEQIQTDETDIEEIIDLSDSETEVSKNNIVATKPNTVEINENTEMLSNVNNIIKEDDFLDLDIVDEGIDLVDSNTNLDTEKQNTELSTIKKSTTMDENLDKNYTEVNSKAKEYFDKKLLMFPIVYTTKLNDMKVLKSIKDLTSIKNENIINDIITESKPINKINVKQTKKPNDLVKEKISCEFGKPPKMELSDKDDAGNIDASNPLLHKPKNCTYSPINLCKNPDFNTRLKRLGVGFLKIERNCQLLKACKPITIDLHKLGENKLVNGVVKLRNNNLENNINIEPNTSTVANTVAPTALPAQALIDGASTYVIQNKHYNKNNKLSNNGLQLKISPTPKNTYKIGVNNPTMSYETPKNETTIPTIVNNILHKYLTAPLPSDVQTTAPTIVDNKPKVRKKRDVQTPQWLTRPLPKVVDDDILLTGDTVRKMLNFFNKGNVFYNGVKNNNKKSLPVIDPVENSAEQAISTPVPEISLTNSNPPPLNQMWYTFSKGCCWVRKYMEVITMKMTGFNDLAPKMGRHFCFKTSSECSCCCIKYWDEFVADLSKGSEGEGISTERMKVHFPFARPEPSKRQKRDRISKDFTKLSQPTLTIVPLTLTNNISEEPVILNTNPPVIPNLNIEPEKQSTQVGSKRSEFNMDPVTPPINIDPNNLLINMSPISPPINVDAITPATCPGQIFSSSPAAVFGVTSQNSTSNVPIERMIEIPIHNEESVASVCATSKSSTSRVPEHQEPNPITLPITSSNNNTIEGRLNHTIMISSKKGKISIDATWLFSQSGQSIQDMQIQNKKSTMFRILPQKPGKNLLNIGPKKLLLTTANISEFEKSQVDNNTIIDISNDDTVPSDVSGFSKSVSDSLNQSIAKDRQIDGANDSAKKSILSDLMEMSGISTVDAEPKMSKEIEIPMPNVVDLSIISSLDEIKWASEKQGKFFTLDFDTGKIVSVIIDKVKKVRPQMTQISNTVIEIDDSDDEEKANKPTKIKLIDINHVPYLIKRKLNTQGTLNTLKKIKNSPRILRTQKKSNTQVNFNPQGKSLVSILKNNMYKNKIPEEHLEKEYLSDSFNAENETVLECENSDEEPLSKLRKLDNTVEPQIVLPVEAYFDVPVEPDDDGETILGI